MESDPCWLRMAPATGPMFGQRAGCVQRPRRGISHWAYSSSASHPLAVTRGIKQPLEQSSLGMEGLNIGELNKHHYDPHAACLPGIKVASMLLCVLLHQLAWLANERIAGEKLAT